MPADFLDGFGVLHALLTIPVPLEISLSAPRLALVGTLGHGFCRYLDLRPPYAPPNFDALTNISELRTSQR